MEGNVSSASAGDTFYFKGERILTDFIKEREWLYRSLRTFFQAFVSTLTAQLMLSGEKELDKKLIFTVLVSSLAAGLSAVMNISSKEGGEIE